MWKDVRGVAEPECMNLLTDRETGPREVSSLTPLRPVSGIARPVTYLRHQQLADGT